MCRYRRLACRAVTRHDDDDDRRAPVSTFFIVSSSPLSLLFVVGQSRGHRDLIDLSSHLRSPVFFYVRFTANARALNSPPPPSSTHHLLRSPYLRDVSQRTADHVKRSASFIVSYTTLEGSTPERVSFTRQEIGSPLAGTFPRRSSCGLCRTTDITDGMRERTRALPSIFSRFRELSLFVPRGRAEKKRRNARRFVCTALATLGCRGPANKRKRERKRVREGEKEREDVN